jgi:energy-coupling factor transporter ATP-binding protein EcfA2
MRLVLNNVGPIREAEFNLSGVVFLCGPHGAGKTAVARALSVASRVLGRGSVEAREAVSLINRGAEKAVVELGGRAVELAWGHVTVRTERHEWRLEGDLYTGVGIADIPLIWVKDGVRLFGTEADGVYSFSRFVEEVLPAYDALEEALDLVNDVLGPAGFQLELWGDSYTQQTAAVFRGEDGEEYEEDAVSEAVLKLAQAAAAAAAAKRMGALLFVEGVDLLQVEYARRLFAALAKLEVSALVEIHRADLSGGGRCYLLKNGGAEPC